MAQKFENKLQSTLDGGNSWVNYGYSHFPSQNSAQELAASTTNKFTWESVRLVIVCHCDIADNWRT